MLKSRKLKIPLSQLSFVAKNIEYRNSSLSVTTLPLSNICEEPWQFSFGDESKLLNKMSLIKPVLSDVCDKIFQGIITGADKVFVLELKSGIEKEIVELYSRALERNVKIEKSLLRPLLKGSLDIRRYRIVNPTKYVIFPYYVNDATAKLIPFRDLEAKFPNCASYLQLSKKILEEREHGKWKCPEWHAFQEIRTWCNVAKRRY